MNTKCLNEELLILLNPKYKDSGLYAFNAKQRSQLRISFWRVARRIGLNLCDNDVWRCQFGTTESDKQLRNLISANYLKIKLEKLTKGKPYLPHPNDDWMGEVK